jgi:hypothetical protein
MGAAGRTLIGRGNNDMLRWCVRWCQRQGGTSHIAPPVMNSYIIKYEFISPVTYELLHMNSYVSDIHKMATDGGGGVVYGSNNWLTLSRLGKRLVSVLQYFTSDLRTIVCIRTQCCPTQHARQSDSEWSPCIGDSSDALTSSIAWVLLL